MIWKQVIGDELYVWYNGELIYKRWISKGYGMVFEKHGYPWVPGDRRSN